MSTLAAYTEQGNNPPLNSGQPRAHKMSNTGQSSAAAVIENTTLRTTLYRHNCAFGKSLFSLSIRNSIVDQFDLARFTIQQDLLMERVQAGYINTVDLDIGGDIIIRDSKLLGEYEGHAFRACLNIPVHTRIERTVFGPGITDLINWQAPHLDPDWNLPIQSQSILLRDCVIPRLKMAWTHTEHLRIERCTGLTECDLRHARVGLLEIFDTQILGALDLSQSHIERLRIVNTQIGLTLDLSGTQLDFPVPEILNSTWRLARLEGSNIHLPVPA